MKPTTIMLVDDNLNFLNITASFLDGYDDLRIVACLNSGKEALSKAQKMRPDIVLVDLTMPEISGFEVIQQLRKVLPALGIIALSMYDTDEYRNASLAAGADIFIPKTCMAMELLPAIKQLNNKTYKEEHITMASKQILVVEDDPHLRRIYSKALLSKGYDVDLAATATEASTLLGQNHYAVFICDIHIGKERGTQVLEEQKERLANMGTQIVMASAHGEYRYQTDELGADFFLEKPFSLDSLTTLVERLVPNEPTEVTNPILSPHNILNNWNKTK